MNSLYPQTPGTSTVYGFPIQYLEAYHCDFRICHHVLSLSGQRYAVSTLGYKRDKDNQSVKHMDRKGNLCKTVVFQEDSEGWINSQPIETRLSENEFVATRIHNELVEAYQNI
jgi:hypothetical protein